MAVYGILFRQLRLTVSHHQQESQGACGVKIIHLLYIIGGLLYFSSGHIVAECERRFKLNHRASILHSALYAGGLIPLLDI